MVALMMVAGWKRLRGKMITGSGKSFAMRCWWVGEGRLAASPSEEQYISGRERDTWSAQRIE